MENLRETTLAELVTQRTGAAVVFEKYQLDFCCKGKRSLADACASQGLDVSKVASELESVFGKQGDDSAERFQRLPLDQLADYIVAEHHAYVRQMIPLITAHVLKVADRHGRNNQNLVTIAERWQELAEELTQHMYKEEHILFPYIKQLVDADQTRYPSSFPTKPFVTDPIRVMELEHDRAGELMAEMRELSNQFTPPLIACTTYRLSFRELQEFEQDLHQHVHLENNLLFPKAKQLEAQLLAEASRLN